MDTVRRLITYGPARHEAFLLVLGVLLLLALGLSIGLKPRAGCDCERATGHCACKMK